MMLGQCMTTYTGPAAFSIPRLAPGGLWRTAGESVSRQFGRKVSLFATKNSGTKSVTLRLNFRHADLAAGLLEPAGQSREPMDR